MTAAPKQTQRAIKLFERHRGILSTSQALRLGIHPRTLYQLRDRGDIQVISRGRFRLASLPEAAQPDLLVVATRAPRAVLCLISALSYHEMTTQIPGRVHIALAAGSTPPRIDHPPIQPYWFSGRAFTEGIEVHTVDGHPLRVYSVEKTVADCFKYRNRIGLEVALEALRMYRRSKAFDVDRLLRFARICRVERVLRPYLEAML